MQKELFMKKFSKILALVLVTVTLSLVLVACGPNSNPAKAKSSLEENGYTVVLADDAISLTVVELVLGCERGDVTARLSGTKANEDKSVDTITVIYFKDSAAAKACWEKAEQYLNKESQEDTDSAIVVKRSGKMIYAGTEAAIKAA